MSIEHGAGPTVEELLARDDELFVLGAYRALLGREPDPEGMGNYLEQLANGTPKVDLLAEIAASPEGQRRAGALGEAILKTCQRIRALTAPAAASLAELLGYHDEQFVRCAYLTILGREADPEGLRHYADQLRGGVAKMRILASLRVSDESRARDAGLRVLDDSQEPDAGELGNGGGWLDLLAHPDRRFIAACYPMIIGRKVQAAEVAARLRELQGGMSRIRMLAALRRSPEGRAARALLRSVDGALRKYKWSGIPVLGRALGTFLAAEGDSGTEMRLRRLENELALLSESLGRAPRTESEEAPPAFEAPALDEPGAAEQVLRPAASGASRLATLPSRVAPGAGRKPARHAAVTMVSKNYFALAATLAESYLAHHPQHDFVIALVDKADGYVPASLECGAEVIELARFAIPDVARFIYRYTIMELNTAVKPYVLSDLFEQREYETLLYLDPDIWVHAPLEGIYAALAEASIVLIPHTRKPYADTSLPSDLTILQSGTYNLGFIGLKRGTSTRQLLDWWMTKLYRDCVVDIPKGLFVDQKWIDLVPGYFPDHRIVHDPTCNAAYWNLHERRLTQVLDRWEVDGRPLTFFHFSGYLPFSPQSLSKHQDRFALEQMPALKSLTDAYAQELMAHGYAQSSVWPYAFETLPNGVRLPLELVRHVMQWACRALVDVPSPVQEPDAFCRFLMSRDIVPGRPRAVLALDFLLKTRGDVASAFPGAVHDADDPGFRDWLRTSGIHECGIRDLLDFERPRAVTDHVADAFERIRKADRRDIFDRLPGLWTEPESFAEFVRWLATQGVKQLRLEPAHAEHVAGALPGIARILNLYFLRGDLQARYPALGDKGQAAELAAWLRANRHELELTQEQISLFLEFALACGEHLEKMRFLYQHCGKPSRVTPGVFEIEARRREIGGLLPDRRMAAYLAAEERIDPAHHYLARYGADRRALGDFAKCSVEGLDSRANFEFVRRIREGIEERGDGARRVNYAGFLTAPSGMGESGRSLRATLAQTPAQVREVTLPHAQAAPEAPLGGPAMFGWPFAQADLSVTVANADCAALVESFLPRTYWAARNIGYWVWETEELPARFKESERLFDQVWTPSQYSADAIARTIGRPVRVLPHTLDFAALDAARADRARYGLPAKGTLFGFAFDPASVLERKNVRGLIRAFREAVREDDDCYLVLKANGRTHGNLDYEMLRAIGDSPRILFLEGTLARDEMHGLMKSLDAYVSLHRSEGFGLTCAEAMALGLPVIATGYSGNLDFMDERNSLLVPATVVETERAHGAYPAGSRWGDPQIDAAAGFIRSLRDAERRRDLGARAAASIRATLDPRAIGARAWSMIEEAVAAGRADAGRP